MTKFAAKNIESFTTHVTSFFAYYNYYPKMNFDASNIQTNKAPLQKRKSQRLDQQNEEIEGIPEATN